VYPRKFCQLCIDGSALVKWARRMPVPPLNPRWKWQNSQEYS
jgi:hypothetical protein